MVDFQKYEADQKAHYKRVTARLMGVKKPKLQVVYPEPKSRIMRPKVSLRLPPEKPVDIAAEVAIIIRQVAEKHGIRITDITGPRRNRNIVVARFEAIYQVWDQTGITQSEIGGYFGCRDHTTIQHSLKRYRRLRLGI